MRVFISDPSFVPDLLAFLDEQLDAITTRVGDNEIEVSLLGSQRLDLMRMELDLRLAIWRAAHPGVEAVVE